MKFRISMKAILWTWSLLIVLLIALGYNAYDKLRPEAFVQLATEQVQKNIPNSQLVVGSVDYSFSVDFNIKLKQITVVRDELQIAKIGELELKIPWWLLITHKGTAQVNVGQVEILLNSNDVKKITHSSEDDTEETSETVEITIPEYLAKAQFTLRAKDVALKNEDASRTYLQISKLLVRGFALSKNSAFEIKLPVWLEHNEQTYNSEIWLFGDLTPEKDKWAFNYTGEFRTKDIDAKISFDDVALEGTITLLLPQFSISSQTNFMIDKEEKGVAIFALDQSMWKLDLDFSALPLEFLGLFEKEILNDYFSKFEGEAQGNISLSQKFEYEDIFLQGKLSYPGKFTYQNLSQEGNWYLIFDNNLWLNRFEGDHIKYSRENLIAFSEGKILEVKETYVFRDLKMDEVLKFIPSLEKATKTEVPEHKSFSLADIKRDDEETLEGSFELTSNIAAFNYSGELKSKNESLKFSYISDVDQSIDLQLKSFKLVSGIDLFSPWINGTGVLNLEFSGRELSQFPLNPWKLKGTINSEDMTGIVPSYLQNLWTVFDRSPKNQELNMFVNNKNSQIKLIDKDDKPVTLEVSLNRNLNNESNATLIIPGKPVKKTVKKVSLDFLRKDSL
ncbi:MAG TPA: hypothetical protein VKY27_08645 [Bacteriovoracaceae bacterium]|nr:hypothetical protein [Bacteriovoracaceae bacterium]